MARFSRFRRTVGFAAFIALSSVCLQADTVRSHVTSLGSDYLAFLPSMGSGRRSFVDGVLGRHRVGGRCAVNDQLVRPTIGHQILRMGETAPTASRRNAMRAMISVGALLTTQIAYAQPAMATRRSTLRGLVNVIRAKEGIKFLETRLQADLLDGFQEGLKLLFRDTEIDVSMKLAAEGLEELGVGTRLARAQDQTARTVYMMSQVVEYDGWDRINKMEINEKFQEMTPEKVEFAKKGLSQVSRNLAMFLELFPEEAREEAQQVYEGVYGGMLSKPKPRPRAAAAAATQERDEGPEFISF